MNKLLTEPKLIKDVVDKPKKKKRYKKIKEGEKPKFTILYESQKNDVNELIRVYKDDPFKARIKFFNGGLNTQFNRIVLFEFENGDFEICNFITKFGIAKNNRIYSNQKKQGSLSYKRGKFWELKHNSTICPMTWAGVMNFINLYEHINTYKREDLEGSKIYQYFKNRFHWVQMLSECPISWAVTSTTIVEKELYGMNKLYRYIMKVPAPIAKLVLDSSTFSHLKEMNGSIKAMRMWVEVLDCLTHVEHLKSELINSYIFMDTCRMARTLNRKINCKWGLKRLKEEHDNWSKEITNILLDCETEYELNIRPIFKSFAEYSGYKLLVTNKDMLREGIIQNHCVGTYIDRVERGACGIYHVDGYTLQVVIRELDWFSYDNKDVNGFSGVYNCNDRYYESVNRKHTSVSKCSISWKV